MKKTIQLLDLDCANCAAKIEDAVGRIAGVQSVNVSFMSQKMELDIEEGRSDAIVKEVMKIARKVDSDITVVV